MELITSELAKTLRANWPDQNARRPPALKLFSPSGAATWLIHSAEPSEPDRLFGLCDLGMGFPELGYVSLKELQDLQIPVKLQMGPEIMNFTISIERDLHFKPTHGLATYLDFTQNPGKVMDDITFVRSHWWLVSEGFSLSTANSDVQKLPATLYHRIADSLAYAA